MEPIDPRVHAVAALDHPITQAVYRLLSERGELSRDDAAGALDLARSVAAFHLDKLTDAGLAEVRFARLTGRSGPGAGRTARVYRRSQSELAVSLPERHYDLAGGLLAQAVERATTEGVGVEAALHEAAFEAGRQIGAAARTQAGPRPGRRQLRGALASALQAHGYEPRLVDGEIVLANCPFHALAERHRTLVCGMNLDLLGGLVDGIGAGGHLAARLAPQTGQCCVRLDAA